jgi:uncharacterized membrane protein YedE/YeeE
MELSTFVQAAVGGALVGLSSFMVLFFQGRVAGISGIVGTLFAPTKGDVGWRVAFVLGMVLTGFALSLLYPALFAPSHRPTPVLVAAGLLVGVGTRFANGCTSGHGVCGLSRLSRRSMAATLTFMLTAALTVFAQRLIAGSVK